MNYLGSFFVKTISCRSFLHHLTPILIKFTTKLNLLFFNAGQLLSHTDHYVGAPFTRGLPLLLSIDTLGCCLMRCSFADVRTSVWN